MIVPVDAQVMSQVANGSAGSVAGSSSSFTVPNLPDPDPAAAKVFAQTMNGSGTSSPATPATPGDTEAAIRAGANVAANVSDINLPASVRFFKTLTMEDLFRMRKAIGEWEYQQIRTDKFSEQTGQALDSVTKQSE